MEPIARVRAKHFDANEMWFEVVRDMHQGLPAAGDEGLDNTHTWGRTYWGGALFCLLAEWRFTAKQETRRGWKMRCAGSSMRAGTYLRLAD